MINKVILVGNLVKAPEIRRLESGAMVATFSLATNESYKDKNGEWQQVAEWHNIVAWNRLAEGAEKYLTKGQQVYIEGKLTSRNYQAKDGTDRYITEVVARVLRRTGNTGGGTQQQAPPPPAQDDTFVDEAGDDLPF